MQYGTILYYDFFLKMILKSWLFTDFNTYTFIEPWKHKHIELKLLQNWKVISNKKLK